MFLLSTVRLGVYPCPNAGAMMEGRYTASEKQAKRFGTGSEEQGLAVKMGCKSRIGTLAEGTSHLAGDHGPYPVGWMFMACQELEQPKTNPVP